MRRLLPPFVLTLAAVLTTVPALAGDRLVTIARPGTLYVFDVANRALERECPFEMDPAPGVIVMSPDGTIAYAIVNRFQDIIGIEIDTCKLVFHAAQSDEEVRRRSMAALAVSPDGAELYTIRNPVRVLVDRYEVLDAEFAVYDTASGTAAEPKAVHPGPRRTTVMAAGDDGAVYAAGHDIFRIDPDSGASEVAIANASWDRAEYSPPDVLAFWPIGTQNDEMLLLYSAAKYASEKQEELVDYVWGYSSVDLGSGETEIRDFASFEVIMFSAVRDPNAPNLLYGVYTQLSKHDVETGELIKRVDLPHTYYNINISSDGTELYVGGTNDDIGVYDAKTLERTAEMLIPSGGDQALSTLQIVPGAPE